MVSCQSSQWASCKGLFDLIFRTDHANNNYVIGRRVRRLLAWNPWISILRQFIRFEVREIQDKEKERGNARREREERSRERHGDLSSGCATRHYHIFNRRLRTFEELLFIGTESTEEATTKKLWQWTTCAHRIRVSTRSLNRIKHSVAVADDVRGLTRECERVRACVWESAVRIELRSGCLRDFSSHQMVDFLWNHENCITAFAIRSSAKQLNCNIFHSSLRIELNFVAALMANISHTHTAARIQISQRCFHRALGSPSIHITRFPKKKPWKWQISRRNREKPSTSGSEKSICKLVNVEQEPLARSAHCSVLTAQCSHILCVTVYTSSKLQQMWMKQKQKKHSKNNDAHIADSSEWRTISYFYYFVSSKRRRIDKF